MGKNEIYIHTDKGSYIGGDVIFGNVFLSIDKPINSKGMILEIVGYEKVMWQYHHTEYYNEDGQQKSRQEVREHKDDRNFFKDSFRLIDYPGGFPVGRFSFPFQYRLPANLPGVFSKKRNSGLKMKAKVQYKIKCIVEIPGLFSHDLKIKQHLVIHEKLDKYIEPKHHVKTAQVRTLCCIPRGPVTCECWMDKNAYMSGETAQIHVSVKNDSAVDITNFNTKLIRTIELEAHGHRQTFRDVVCQQKYPGTPTMTNRDADCPLPLFGKRGHHIQPYTNSKLVKCNYTMMVEMSVPWAPDVEIHSPVSIYAPQNPLWAQWQPPVWIAEAQPQAVCNALAVPQEVMNAQMQQGYFQSPVSPPVPSYNPNNSRPSAPQNNVVDERAPLLG